jgi:hypothetical protein
LQSNKNVEEGGGSVDYMWSGKKRSRRDSVGRHTMKDNRGEKIDEQEYKGGRKEGKKEEGGGGEREKGGAKRLHSVEPRVGDVLWSLACG